MEHSGPSERAVTDLARSTEAQAPAAPTALGSSRFSSVEPMAASSTFAPARPSGGVFLAQGSNEPCCARCAAEDGGSKGSYAYVLGHIEARFPRLSVEKELAQATGRAETAGHTDRQAFHDVLSRRENRYLARQMCWVLSIQGLEAYIVAPRDPADLDVLIATIEPRESAWISAVIGVRGPIAPPEYCNGLAIPILIFDQVHTFSRRALIEAIPRPEQMPAGQFESAAGELFDRIMQMTDNAGTTDGNRALNYLSVRYSAIYAKAAEEFARDFSLTAVETRASPLSGARSIVDVIFAFTNRNTDYTEKFFVRVDVTEEFPFLVNKLSPFYDR